MSSDNNQAEALPMVYCGSNSGQAMEIVTLKAMQSLTGRHRCTLYRWVKEGQFPTPLKRKGRTIGWPLNKYLIWLESQG